MKYNYGLGTVSIFEHFVQQITWKDIEIIENALEWCRNNFYILSGPIPAHFWVI